MKKKLVLILVAAMSFTLAGCNSNKEADATASDATATDAAVSNSDNSESEITDYGDVNLCDYKNLSANKTIYTVDESAIDDEISYYLYEFADYVDVDRPSQEGDYVDVTMTASSNGEIIYDFSDEEGYSIYLGYEEFGPEFNEKLTGVSAGDELNFTVTFEDDYYDEALAGLDVDFSVTVKKVTEEKIPELTEEFITENLGYDSEEDMRNQIAEQLEEANNESSEYELRENLIQQVISNSTFSNYPQELYDMCAESVKSTYEEYTEMFGVDSVEEIYEMFGMEEADIEEEILTQLYRFMTVYAIVDAEEISISDTEYNDALEYYVDLTGAADSDELISQYGEESIFYWILEDKVIDILEENANITEVPYDESQDDIFGDFEEENDGDIDDAEEIDISDEIEIIE